MGPIRTRMASVGVASLLMVSLAGCSTIEKGVAIRDPNADPGAVNTALLDPGKLTTKPRSPLGEAGVDNGPAAEARRMGEVVLLPVEADPALSEVEKFRIDGPQVDLGDITSTFSRGVSDALGANHFVAGYAQSGQGGQSHYDLHMSLVVLRVDSPEAAAAALKQIADKAAAPSGEDGRMEPVPTPDRPGVVVLKFKGDYSWTDAQAFTTRGPLLVGVATRAKEAEAGVRLALTALDKQMAGLGDFAPTPMDKLAQLPLDTPGLVARTLPGLSSRSPEAIGLFGRRAAVGFMDSPAKDLKVLTENNLEWMSRGLLTNVYQFRDAAGARAVADTWAKDMGTKKYTRAGAVNGLPSARCFASPKDDNGDPTTYYCLLATDRYLIEVPGVADEAEAHQRLAAQYLMVSAK